MLVLSDIYLSDRANNELKHRRFYKNLSDKLTTKHTYMNTVMEKFMKKKMNVLTTGDISELHGLAGGRPMARN